MDQASSSDDSGITLRIRFKSESIDQFIARYGTDVSPGGIFIRTREPLGVGTGLRFEFSLADGQALLVGQGTVVWVREPEQARAGVVPGMGVRFDRLTAHSQNVLGSILAGKTRRDGNAGAPRPSVVGRPLEPGALQARSGSISSAAPPVTATARSSGSSPSITISPIAAGERAPADSPFAAADARAAAAQADPWQSDKTELATLPPGFRPDGPRTSEEMSLSALRPDLDLGGSPRPMALQPSAVVETSTRPGAGQPGLPTRIPRPPAPGLGEAIRPQPSPQSTPLRRVAPAAPVSGLGPADSGPVPPGGAGLDSDIAALLDSPLDHPSPTGGPTAPMTGRGPSATVPLPGGGRPGQEEPEHASDPFNRDGGGQALAGPPPGRAKMLAVIGIAAAATALGGFFILKNNFPREAGSGSSGSAPVGELVAPVPRGPVGEPFPAPPPSAAEPAKAAPAAAGEGAGPGSAPTAKPTGAEGRGMPAPDPGTDTTAPPSAAAVAPATPPAAGAGAGAGASPPVAGETRPARPVRPKPVVRRPVEVARPSSPEGIPAAGETTDPGSTTAAAAEEIFWLRVRSTPPGADVLIDGQLEGKTPFQRRIFDTTRPYALTVRKPGFDPHEQLLSASDDWVKGSNGRTLTVTAKLAKTHVAAPGTEPAPGVEAVPAEKGAVEPTPAPTEPAPAPAPPPSVEPAPTTPPPTAPPDQP